MFGSGHCGADGGGKEVEEPKGPFIVIQPGGVEFAGIAVYADAKTKAKEKKGSQVYDQGSQSTVYFS